jgi:hypothetical protein
MTTLLLVHGGLWEAGMDADRFWSQPGIVAGLEKRSFDVLAPDRPEFPPYLESFLNAVAAFAEP